MCIRQVQYHFSYLTKTQGGDVLKYKHLYGAPNKKADTYYNLTPAVKIRFQVSLFGTPLVAKCQFKLEK